MADFDLIIVLVGESGSGKSFILREILSKYPNIELITKYTTRKSRIDESGVLDVRGNVSLEDICCMDYQYINCNNLEHYAFKKEEIDDSLERGKIPCLDLSNENSYLQLLNDYPNNILLLKVVPYYDTNSLKKVFEEQGRSQKEFEQRKESLNHPLTDWVYHYKNIREIVNPFFMHSISKEISIGVLKNRLESILLDECNKDLGVSYTKNNRHVLPLYQYLYHYSKNKPKDEPLDFTSKFLK